MHIQNQHTNIGCFLIHLSQTIWKGNYENNFIYNSIKKKKILKNKFKEVKELCTENYKILIIEIKEDTNKGKFPSAHGHGLDNNIVKINMIPKMI